MFKSRLAFLTVLIAAAILLLAEGKPLWQIQPNSTYEESPFCQNLDERSIMKTIGEFAESTGKTLIANGCPSKFIDIPNSVTTDSIFETSGNRRINPFLPLQGQLNVFGISQVIFFTNDPDSAFNLDVRSDLATKSSGKLQRGYLWIAESLRSLLRLSNECTTTRFPIANSMEIAIVDLNGCIKID